MAGVAEHAGAEQISEMFADIFCSDPEWVDREFAEIIAGLLGQSSAVAGPGPGPRSADSVPHWPGAAHDVDGDRPRWRMWSIRSPPSAHSLLRTAFFPQPGDRHHMSTIARSGTAEKRKEIYHYVNVV